MSWTFVARTEHIECLRGAIRAQCGGPIVVIGEPRMGRSSVLRQALRPLDERHTAVVALAPAGNRAPFAALAGALPAGFAPKAAATSTAVGEVADALAEQSGGRRLVIVVDDAHRVDHPSMLVVRELHRRAGALPLITQPAGPAGAQPDPLDCLRHEAGLRTLRLGPLSWDEFGALIAGALGGPVRPATVAALHAATGGNPGLLHDLLVRDRLTDRMVNEGGPWRLGGGQPGGPPVEPGGSALHTLRAAVAVAWRDLELDKADELCRLASWSGLAEEVAPMRAGLSLLRGRAGEGLRLLESCPAGAGTTRVLMVRALLLALGHGQVERAAAMLAEAARDDGPARDRLLANRAWLLASTGRTDEAREALAGPEPHADREAYVYALAAHATIALADARPQLAVGRLRRALAGARHWRHEVPWLAPYLTANLIDALLLAGRITEATATAADFHAGAHGCGWRVAVTIADLTAAAAERPLAGPRSAKSTTPVPRRPQPAGPPVEQPC